MEISKGGNAFAKNEENTLRKNPQGVFLVHRKVAETSPLTPPSKPIIFLKNRGFWGIFALFFNFAQNSI